MKTLAIRLEDEQHAKLGLLAKLSGETVVDVIRSAVDRRLTEMAADPELSAKAEGLRAAIQAEAAEQAAALAGLFASDAATTKPSKRTQPRSQTKATE